MGRIKSINNGETITYEYDSYGQLTKEVNNVLDKTIEYRYNGIGNIESVTTKPTGGTATTVSYTYNTAYPDRLTRVGSNSISYNSMGCITSYNSRIYRWERGKLAGYTRGSMSQPGSPYENCVYTYNALGQRVSKTYTYDPNPAVSNDASYTYTTTYTYDNSGRLIREYTTETHNINGAGTRELVYLYDESGVIGVIYYVSGALQGTYYYHRNLLGDVTAIYSANGVKQAEYAYDAFGNCTTIYGASSSIGKYNPIRYRGYYCDIETNWYFLNSRYYAPELRRFISPDDTAYLDPKTPNGLNLYCYCNNDPINRFDPSGHAWEWSSFWQGLGYLATGIGAIVAGALVVASGVATWPMLLIAGITIGAGALTTINGASEILEAGTGYNLVEDTIFEGNSSAYITYATITGTVATVGSVICGGWYKYNTPRIQAYKNIANANFPGDYYPDNIASRPYFDSVLTQKNIIKYGKMTKSIGKNGKIFYEFTVKGTAMINGSLNSGVYELVLTSDYKLIWHLLFNTKG